MLSLFPHLHLTLGALALSPLTSVVMSLGKQSRPVSTSSAKRAIPEPRPSASIMVISARNEVLLLHRVGSSTSFASAHVFPGGNLDSFHEGANVAGPESPEKHRDGPAYRLGAIRECFEETGILLALNSTDGRLVNLSSETRDEARRNIHQNKVVFGDWVASLGAVPDTDNLVPFTRWITPPPLKKRFTTQMYLYFLPISSTSPSEMLIPTPDGGIEHTAALFAPAARWLSQASTGDIILFPPQYYLLTLLARFLVGPGAGLEEGPAHCTAQRRRLVAFLRRVPTAQVDKEHPTAKIPWADKVISPYHILIRRDGRVVLGLEKPGLELEDTQRGGDMERVILVKPGSNGPQGVEVQRRVNVLEEERAADEQSKL
ncbi:hypothetical protein CDD82_6693 [Ophiocordyceps australis]|uniref:Nudix hydrolase domain-containing protein n=1 Tax=Ophiocordyceps australis TaxID=1399860 RepID=A0A2C5ZQC8_9HYPO|nr:hypothetical protein CDD82_6693 [Ophiocordyceps australis]